MLERAAALGIMFSLGLVAGHAWPATIHSQTGAYTKRPANLGKLGQITGLLPIPVSAHETDSSPQDAPAMFYLHVPATADMERVPLYPEGSDPAPAEASTAAMAGQNPDLSTDTDITSTEQEAAGEDTEAGPEAGADEVGPPEPETAREVSDRSGATDSAIPIRLKQSRETHGLATYYHPSLEGRTMANGMPYVSSAMTAASNRWPLGTILRVTYDSSVEVEITDRGNFTHALDLSAGAFRALAGSLRPGVIWVAIEEEGEEENDPE